jgi:hypothetical protein
MGTITTLHELKNAIHLLKTEQVLKGNALKEKFQKTYKSLKPVSIFINLAKDAISTPYVISAILTTTIGLATGFYTKKIIVGASAGIIRKLMGSAISSGVTAIIVRHPEVVTSAGKFIARFVSARKTKEPITRQI